MFSRSIECLKIHVLQLVQKSNFTPKDGEILWVLTVPAIWDDSAKVFMREAAIEVILYKIITYIVVKI